MVGDLSRLDPGIYRRIDGVIYDQLREQSRDEEKEDEQFLHGRRGMRT